MSSTSENRRLVIVTGGSRGIGKALCILLASKGYDVALNYRTNTASADAIVKEIDKARERLSSCQMELKAKELAAAGTNSKNAAEAAAGKGVAFQTIVGRVIAFQADVSKREEVKQMFLDIDIKFPDQCPYGLVNNAGIIGTHSHDLLQCEKHDLDKVLGTNVYGPFYCCQEFVKRASTSHGGNGGAIVNVSSGSAYIGNPLIYAMSKGALDSMAAGLSKTLPPQGIRVNTVIPGATDTDMPSQDLIKESINITPMGRIGRPEEIAEGVYFFLSDGSSYCSGAKIRMSGGKP